MPGVRSTCLTLLVLATCSLGSPLGNRVSAQDAGSVSPEPDAATPAVTGEDEVQALLAAAVAEYDAARYAEALALFRRAHELAPTARTLRGIGMAAFESGLYVAALRALRASLLETERALTDAQRDHVSRLIERTEAFVAILTLDVSPAGATVLIDGADLTFESDGSVLLDPGHHVITVVDGAERSQNLEVDLVGGTERSVRIRADSLGRGTVDPLLIGGITTLVAGGVLAIAATATGVVANELYGQLRADCDGFVCPGTHLATRDRAAELALATDILGGVGAAVMATGVILTIVGTSSSTPPPVTLACSGTGCTAMLEGSF